MKATVVKGLMALGLSMTATLALASPTCTEAPQDAWLSTDEMKQRIGEMGYEIKAFKTTDGHCYEIYGWDDQQRRVEIYFDPVDGSIVEQEIDD
ncbi:PepSY domain-containing protein [Halomonas nitroreducens]|uniref:PepSY domain-containing protein n=1 Tax=Halomonas nitroreducens TaxID=447425 RepID=A0A3S0JTV9_9GAMM|nr:PepSY domain-containing protein [Halomonas nitroreducens]RTQ99181.1 PepSY domain-containing protein [Halomonas nitroreducens]